MDSRNQIQKIVGILYDQVQALEELFPGRRFTLDGHLVGSLGEVLAAEYYNLELLPASTPVHDATGPAGQMVQIKATQRSSVGLRSKPDYLLVLKMEPDGSFSELYNGPGAAVWKQCGKLQSNGQRAISASRLQTLAESVPPAKRLPMCR